MNYIKKLKNSSDKTGNFACFGLDPIFNVEEIIPYFEKLFKLMKKNSLIPSAFKPNLGYYSVLDKPREGKFQGSIALGKLLDLLESEFPEIPVILDSKRGDIARSSLNYSKEAFDCWKTDAVTISPFMGFDSISPFLVENKCAYVLNRTSNVGGKDFQNLVLENDDTLYEQVSKKIIKWNKLNSNAFLGAVAGATNMKELAMISKRFSKEEVPLLIPGVGSQGGSALEVKKTLKESNYPLYLARVNSSSKLTHPWKKPIIVENALELCIANIKTLLKELEI